MSDEQDIYELAVELYSALRKVQHKYVSDNTWNALLDKAHYELSEEKERMGY